MTKQRKIGRVLVTASAILTILLAFACGATKGVGSAPPVDTASSAPPSTQATSTTTTADPTSAATASPTSEATTAAQPAQPAPAHECVAADLALAVDSVPGGGAAGTVYRSLVFTNTSDSPCVIVGFAGVSYVTGDSGEQVGAAAERVGEKGDPVTVPVGGTAVADIGFTQVGNFDPAECEPTPVRGLRVYPPHDTAAMFVPQPGTGCAGDVPSAQLTVRTVQGP